MSFTQIDLERHSKNQSLTSEKIKDNSVTTSKIRIDNDLNFYGYRITNLGDPLNDYDAANKKYVDSLINGLSWKNPVDSIISYDNLPTNLSVADKGKRFLINFGAETNKIFEWDGYQWIRYQPQDNWAVFNKENDNAYVYDAQSNNDFKWILFTSLGGAIVYNGGVGIDISNNVISAKLGAGITSLPNGHIGIDIEPNTGLAFDSDPLLNANAKLKIDSTKVVTTYSSSTINSEITFSDSSTLNVNGDFVFKSKLIQDFVNFYSETIQVENSTNIINLNYTPLNSIDTQIFINGVLQISGYSIDTENKRIIFEESIPVGSVVKVFYFTNEGNAANGMVIGYLSGGPIIVDISQANNVTAHSLKIIKTINNTGDVLDAWKLVYIDSSGNVQLASNTSENTIALGIVKDTVNNGEDVEIITEGILQIPDDVSINNRFIYLGENGDFIDAIPQGSGRVVQLIGEKIGPNYLIIKPQLITVTLS